MRAHLIVFAALAICAGNACATESLFTPLDLDHCRTIVEDQGGVVLSCKGLPSYSVTYKEGDSRPSLFYGKIDKKLLDSGWESFAAFASAGKTVEWRLENGKPHAAILRFFLSDPNYTGDGKEKKGQVLLVSKVATEDDPSSCAIGMVDALANPNANAMARDLADRKAAEFTCGSDEADYEGVKGPLASDFSSNLGSLEQQ